MPLARPRPQLVLASRSPQRRGILEQLGVDFRAIDPGVEEDSAGDPARVALENAERKARAGARTTVSGSSVVLGVDTVVALDGRIYDKPRDAAEARATLSALGGRRHAVLSAIALIRPGRAGPGQVEGRVETTQVDFRPLPGALIEWYVASGEWRGRAGGYAIQGRGAALVRRIEGDYLNVVGLPLAALLELLPELVPGA